MTDLEIVKKCAEAMGYTAYARELQYKPKLLEKPSFFNPLHDDAQALALVKRFKLVIGYSNGWSAQKRTEDGDATLMAGSYHYPDLNRAICECVAKMEIK